MLIPRAAWFTAAGIAVVVVAVALVTLFSGAYNVAATAPHTDFVRWTLNTLQRNSVSARAGSVEGEPPTDSAALHHGLEHYDGMCVQCHGAPGVDRGEVGRGMTPTPPELSEAAREWSDAELFWITKHGIKLAGMPAFGSTHSDEEIWGIVALLRRLPEMTPEEYAARTAAFRAAEEPATSGDGHDHTH